MSTPASWDGRSYGGRLGHGIFLALIRAAGRWPAYLLLAIVVPYYCLIARKAVRASRDYLGRRLGPARWPRSLFRTYKHFFEFGQVLIDRFIFYTRGGKSFGFTGEGWENVESALADGKGAIFLSAHLGAWELASAVRRRFERNQLPVPLNVVMHVPEGKRVPSFVEILEREGDLKVIPISERDAVPFEIVGALERREIVALHGDRIVSDATARVPFLGADASFPAGPWQIAAVTGAPIVPVFLVKTGWRQYHFQTFPPIRVKFTSRAERQRVIEAGLTTWKGIVEELLAKHPYQWFNFYSFWN